MSEPSALFRNRKKVFYKDFVQHFDLQGPRTLAGATFQSDYFLAKENERNNNLVFVNKNGAPVKLMIFGEIAPSSKGTILCSKGNYYMTPNSYIVDSTKPKFCLALARPTCATTNINILFDNEGSELTSDYFEITKQDKPDEFLYTNWSKSSQADGQGTHDIYLVYFGPIYNVPPSTSTPTPSIAVKRRLKMDEDEDETEAKADERENKDLAASTSKSTVYPNEREIHLGAYYNPYLLPDYGGDLFHHNAAKLVQHDVRDTNNQLIPPWKYYEELRPGTMVLCNVTMHVYFMSSTKQTKVRKVFKLNAENIKILAKSDLPVEPHPQPTLLNEASSSSSQSRSTQYQHAASDDAFTSFNVTDKGLSPDLDLMDIEWPRSESEQTAAIGGKEKRKGKGKPKA